MNFLFKLILLGMISISLVGCFGNDKPTDTDIKNALYEPNDYLAVQDIERLNGVSLADNRYKVMYKYKIVFKENPKKIPDDILINIASYVVTDGEGFETGFIGMMFSSKLKAYLKELRTKSIGDTVYEGKDETTFIKSENGWIPE